MSGEFDADVIVVGAGMLGGLAAYHLAKAGKAVLILEAGPRVERAAMLEAFRNAPNKNDMNGFYPELPHAPKSSGGPYSDVYIEQAGPMRWNPSYLRLVGGTTWHWSSAFWRMVPNDFKLRTVYGQGRDWPIDYADLEPWYTLAEKLTGCVGNDADDQGGGGGKPYPPRSAPYPMPPEPLSTFTKGIAAGFNRAGMTFIDEPHLRASQEYNGRPPCFGNNNCSPICPIGAMYSGDMTIAAAEAAGARVMPDTVVVRLEQGSGGKIAAVHTMTPAGKPARLTARTVILAAHAIETPKLMLISGVGNRSDQVGRNLMTHPSMFYEAIVKDALWPGRGPVQQGSSNDWRDGPHRARHSAYRYLSNQRSANPGIAERLIRQGVWGRDLDRRIRHDAARYVSLIAGGESLPHPANRITLSTRRDALGLPTPRIAMDIDEYVRAAAPQIAEDFARLDKAFEPIEKLSDRSAWRLPAHPMGSTIMGADPATSVVDRDCRVHDHPNLFVASTAVFASASCVNPTLTGAALALRSADIIAREV